MGDSRIRARSGWLDLPQRPPVPETGAHLPELHPEIVGALVWNRTSVSCSSGRRHHQIGYKGKLWPGCCPATGIVDYSVVKDLLRCATKSFGDEDSNLD
jgi:hypothetical protein